MAAFVTWSRESLRDTVLRLTCQLETNRPAQAQAEESENPPASEKISIATLQAWAAIDSSMCVDISGKVVTGNSPESFYRALVRPLLPCIHGTLK